MDVGATKSDENLPGRFVQAVLRQRRDELRHGVVLSKIAKTVCTVLALRKQAALPTAGR
jgi:hypothetical protein